MSAVVRASDGPWSRITWSLPAAVVITALALAAFLALLAHARAPAPPPPKPPAVWFVELPTPPKPAPVAVSAKPQELPPPPKEKPQSPRPHHILHHEPRREPTLRKQPPPRETPPPAAAPSPPTRPAFTPPGGATMGARTLYKPTPEIPEELRHRHLSLVALARFRVAADGSASAELIQATPDPRLNAALLRTLGKWRFFPAMQNGHPVASTIDIRIPIEVQ